jgi:hypothetical protein
MLSYCQTLELRGVHAASVEMVYPTTRKRFQYIFVGLVICQAMRWVHHGEEVPENELVTEDDVTDEDRMDEMLNAICPEFEADFEDPPTPEVHKFF